MKTLIVTLLQ